LTRRRDEPAGRHGSTGLHIGLDLTALLPRLSGVDRYLTELVAALARADATSRFTLFINRADRDRFAGLPSNFTILAIGFRPRIARLLLQQAWLPPACASRGVDVLHSPSFLLPWSRGSARHLLTVHDMTLFSMPEVHARLRRSHAFRRMVLASIRRADLISVPSRSVRDELLARVPGIGAGRVRVTPWGVAERFSREDHEDDRVLRARLPWIPHAPYVLSLCALEPRKNLPRLVEAFGLLIREHGSDAHLVLAGALDHGRDAVLAAIAASAHADRVHLPGFVPDDVLPALYRRARVFAYPSLGEGFGFPPLEAMAAGVPVVAATGSSLDENLGGAAMLIPPNDPRALAAALHKLLTDPGARANAVAAGIARAARFSWDETARLTLDCYRTLAGTPRGELLPAATARSL
jgi:glycosyltransferase involved in cell wall biosynthesis